VGIVERKLSQRTASRRSAYRLSPKVAHRQSKTPAYSAVTMEDEGVDVAAGHMQ